MRKYKSNPEQDEARKQKRIELCKRIAALDPEQKAALSQKIVCPINPDGHQFSPINSILMAWQGLENPTVVAGFQQWKKAGRQVMKGQHGVSIRFPKTIGDTTEKKSENSTESPDCFFLWTTVFDISQTEALDVA